MAIQAHWEEAEGATGLAREPRRKLLLETHGELPSGDAAAILVHDISTTGLLVESSLELAMDERISVDLPQIGNVWARVIWSSGKLFGCQFHTPISQAALSAAELRSAVGQHVQVPHARGNVQEISFADRLQRLRKARGISQSYIATRLGVSKPTVWAWEHGKARPAGSRIADLAEVLGVTPNELLSEGQATEVESLIARSRDQIAAAYGTSPDKVKIWVEL